MKEFYLSISGLNEVFLLCIISFIIAILWTPVFTDFLFKNKLGKRIRETGFDETAAPIYHSLHKGKENTPTMGGILVWLTVAVVTISLNLSRSGTWLPLFALVATGIIGAIDDLLNIKGIGPNRGGFPFRYKLILYLIIASIGAWWFYAKLGWNIIHIPTMGNFTIGLWYIPLFIIVLVLTAFAANETDGLDGLAGGVFAMCFGAYSVIALTQGKVELAAFCGTIMGALLAFLWFNIYPARFFMGDTGSMSLGMTLGVVAFLTNSVVVLPIIASVLMIEALSVALQISSKKIRKKKIFLSAPIHHHFEALGWPEAKVTMRFWLISAVSASIGLILALLSHMS